MYLQNPFVIIGIVGIMYHLWNRNKISREQEKYDELIKDYIKNKKEKEKEQEKDEEGLLLSFKRDVEKMSNEELISTIQENEKNLTKIADKKQKNELAKMIKFCADTYNDRPKKNKF